MVKAYERAVEHIIAGPPRQHVAARPAGPPEAAILTPLAPALAPDVESGARQVTGKPKQPEYDMSGCYARPHNYARPRKRKLARPNPEARRQQQFPPVRVSPYYHNLFSAPEPGRKARGISCLNPAFLVDQKCEITMSTANIRAHMASANANLRLLSIWRRFRLERDVERGVRK